LEVRAEGDGGGRELPDLFRRKRGFGGV